MADIGAKISIDGAKKFRDDLKNIQQQGKTLTAQMDALASSFDNADDKEEILDKATKNLADQIENQKKIVDKLAEAVAKSADEKGEDATQTLKLQEQLAKAEAKLSKLEGTTAESALGMKDLADKEEDVANESDNASGKIGAMTIALGELAADAIKAGIKGIADAVKEIAQFFIDATKGAADFADEINTLSKTTGLSTDTLQEYKYAASLLDVDLETITGSMTKLTKSMSSAKDGSGAAADAFEKLGVSVTDENGNLRDTNDVFNDAIAALGEIENEAERDATAMEIFGKSAQDLNPLIEASNGELEALRQEAHDVGYVMSEDTLDAMNEVQDGFDRLGLAADSAKNQIGAAIGQFILPYMNEVVSAVQDLLKTGDIDEFIDRISDVINDLVAALMDALPTILTAGAEIIGKLIMGINSMLPQLAPTAVELISKFAMFIVENLPTIINTALDIILALAQGIGEQLPVLIPAIIQMIMSIVTGIADHIGMVIDAALTIVDGLIDGLTSEQGINAIIDAVPKIITALINGILNSLPKIIGSGVNIIVNLVSGLIQGIPRIIQSIPEIIRNIVSAFREYDWGSIGSNIMSNIGSGVKEKATYILSVVKDAFSKALDWIKNLGTEALTWGKHLIEGFVDGIKSAANWLWDEIKSVGSGIADFLGFSVPKKGALHYYESWMPDFMMGLAKGIDENAWRVQDALADMTVGMALSGKTTNVDMGGINVNVYASPNQDANAIARQVMAVMQNEYNAKKAVFA